jgi:hypothetical protein
MVSSRVRSLPALAFLVILFSSGHVIAQSSIAHVAVMKVPTPNRGPESPFPAFSPITSTRPAAAGFNLVADYTARTLFEGPAASASKLVEDLIRDGYAAELATELETVVFNDYRFDVETGAVTPPENGRCASNGRRREARARREPVL